MFLHDEKNLNAIQATKFLQVETFFQVYQTPVKGELAHARWTPRNAGK